MVRIALETEKTQKRVEGVMGWGLAVPSTPAARLTRVLLLEITVLWIPTISLSFSI